MIPVWEWLKAWFDPRAFGSMNGFSLSRRLLALWVIVLAFCISWDVVKHGLTIASATVATGVAATLAGIWGVGNWKGGQT